MTELTIQEKRKLYRQQWRKNNPEKLKAQKQRYYAKHYEKKIPFKPYENDVEQNRLKKRLDAAFLADSYLRENIARRLKMKTEDVPNEFIEVSRPLLQIKRKIREINTMTLSKLEIVKLIEIVKRTANNSCCLCCDKCLSCDAVEVLRELGIK